MYWGTCNLVVFVNFQKYFVLSKRRVVKHLQCNVQIAAGMGSNTKTYIYTHSRNIPNVSNIFFAINLFCRVKKQIDTEP